MTATLSRSQASVSADKPAPSRRRPGPLTLDIVREQEEFLALSPWWDALVDECSTRSPFLRWDWVSLWLQGCAAQGSTCTLQASLSPGQARP